MDSNLFNSLLTIITFVITIGGGFLINYLNKKIESQNLKDYYNISKQIVMSIEQLNPELVGADKKELAISKLLELTNNKINSEQANTLIEAAVYEVKKLLQNNNITKYDVAEPTLNEIFIEKVGRIHE